MTLIEAVRQCLDYCRQLDRYLRQQFPGDLLERSGDRLTAGPLHRLALGRPTGLEAGRVLETSPGLHSYKVQPDGARLSLTCSLASQGSLGPVGARPLALLTPGARVHFLRHAAGRTGVILGVEPPPRSDARLLLPDQVSLASRCGLQVDGAFNFLLRLGQAGGLIHHGCGRPLDGLPGDAGWLSELGVGVFVDSFMTFLRADEDTGFWAFYDNSLSRWSGHNQDRWSAGCVEEHRDDEGEFYSYRGVTPYPGWEALGALRPGLPLTRPVTSKDSQLATPHYAPLEPLFDDLAAFHRQQRYEGYLAGGGTLDFLTAPPAGDYYRLSESGRLEGLLCVAASAAGRYSIESAGGISLRKRPLVHVPRRLRRPEDPGGDNSTNYRAAGFYGSGPPQSVQPGLPSPPAGDPLAEVADPADGQAYDRWSLRALFRYHERDFSLPGDGDALAEPCPPRDYPTLGQQQFLPPPATRPAALDHRLGTVLIPLVEAHFELTPGGALSLGLGDGCEVRTLAGNLELSCPGDLVLRPGRRLIVMAGSDVVVRAKECLDLSATHGDVRLKASTHVQMVAGTSGTGALLLEGRGLGNHDYANRVGTAVVSAGVLIKSAGDLALLGGDLYLRAGNDGSQPRQAGDLLLDAAAGSVRAVGERHERLIASEAVDVFGTPGAPQTVNRFTPDAVLLQGTLALAGDAVLSGNLLAGGEVSATGSVSTVADRDKASLQQTIDQLTRSAPQQAAQDAQTRYASETVPVFYATGMAGDPAVRSAAGFSFRASSQYGSTGYFFYETRWQQQARLSGQELAVWQEEALRAGSTTTWPFPGEAVFESASGLRTFDPVLHDLTTGSDRLPRDARFETAAYPLPVDRALNTSYLVSSTP